jgi:uncharacterized protein YndB with AHSA1/START domain
MEPMMIPDLTTLQLTLMGDTDVLLRRDFSHPPHKVWRALTEPRLLSQWISSRDTVLRCEVDLRPGGSFRYEWPEFVFFGPILKVDAPHHMIHVEQFSAEPDYRVEVITDLVAQASGTRMTKVMRYATSAAREHAIKSGFTDNMETVYGRIEGLALTD